MRTLLVLIALWGLNFAMAPSQDFLDSLLHSVGWTRDSLGFTPQARWVRMPDPRRLPYRLPFFLDLWRHPMGIYEFAKSFSEAAATYLDPERRLNNADGVYRALYFLTVDRWVTGFRPYSANVVTKYTDQFSLENALIRLWQLGKRLPYRPPFGGNYVNTEKPWDRFVQAVDSLLPETVQRSLALLLHNLADAVSWYQVAMRKVPADVAARVVRIRDLHTTQSDGTVYYPEIDDAMEAVDWHAFLYAAIKSVAATEAFVHTMRPFWIPSSFQLRLETPLGEILLGGSGNDTLRSDHPLLVVDFGGNDTYYGSGAGAVALQNPVSVMIDLAGDDRYETTEDVSFGAGILGIGVLWDCRGDDRYQSHNITQGSGQVGMGVLVDEAGDDQFAAGAIAQGSGMLGIGVLLDLDGKDEYRILGNGQGDGEFGGIGILVDYTGSDFYYAEPWAATFNRGDYHSDYRVNISSAQGFGGGRRGDGSDGHSWAGGLGVLVDLAGDDRYVSGNWSMGTAYWFGVGILLDEGGNDRYESCYFTQASGAHFAIGALIEEAGDDRHELFETMGAALGFGWDCTVAFFLDRSGNDFYRAKKISFGVSQIRSQAFFFELGGDDEYVFGAFKNMFGAATPYQYAQQYSPLTAYFYWLRSIGLFLDLGGQDQYRPMAGIAGGTVFQNNSRWRTPMPDGKSTVPVPPAGSYGIGVDREGGTIRELQLWQKRQQK